MYGLVITFLKTEKKVLVKASQLVWLLSRLQVAIYVAPNALVG